MVNLLGMYIVYLYVFDSMYVVHTIQIISLHFFIIRMRFRIRFRISFEWGLLYYLVAYYALLFSCIL